MPRGFGAIKQAGERIEKASNSSEDYDPVLFLKLPGDEDSAVVRFLEQGDEVYSFQYHDFSNIDKPNGWKTKVPCLDQDDEGNPCPGCREGLPRKFQGLINVIWRNAPLFKRDEDNRVVKEKDESGKEIPVVLGNEDQVAVWRQGITVFNKVLRRKDDKFKGLSTRDFEIIRDGVTMQDTTYSVEPSDPDGGATDLSEQDVELANNKYDLDKVARFVDKETFETIIENRIGDENEDDDVKSFLSSEPFPEKKEE